MRRAFRRRVYTSALILLAAAPATPARAADAVVKVGLWNVRSGKGIAALPGRPAPYVDSNNCTDPSQPLNAWGAGAVQAELTKALTDPAVVALAVNEAWGSVCASPERIRQALGWKTATREQNGIAIVARYGFSGAEQWLQLDTSQNPMPADTMWVMRAPVCLDAACAQTLLVYAAHWYASGTASEATYNRQAQQTVQFLTSTSGGQPHVFVGDLNVWEGTTAVCSQTPNNTALSALRGAGYVDGWLTANGAAEGYTGMVNRAGCGSPEGYPFKRIDYAWTPASYPAIAMTRFGLVTPGSAAPSDHAGVLVTVPYPGTPPPAPVPAPAPSPSPTPIPSSSDNIVLHAKNATVVGSAWGVVADASAAGAARLANADAGVPKLAAAAAAPASYFEIPFTAQTGRAYRLWIRGRAENDSWTNDSTFVQFSGSLSADGAAAFRIGTTSATVVSIEEGSGTGLSGWGWQDNGYGVAVLGPVIYFDAPSQKLRVQVREDGLSIDQIVLSPVQYIALAPGAGKNDGTVLVEQTGQAAAPPPPAATGAVPVTWTQVVNAATNGSELWKSRGCGECSDAGAISTQTVTDAAVTFTIANGYRLVVGLGRDTSTNTGYAIDYAFSFNERGGFEIREAGVYRREGTFAGTDVFKIAVTGTTVRYYRNATLIYTSAVPAASALVVDTSLQSIGGGVTSATIVK